MKNAVEPELVIDQFVTLDEIGIPLVQEISGLAPFGPGNPPVRFATKDLVVVGIPIWEGSANTANW